MNITINIYYTGKNGAARRFVEEMISSGTVEAIRSEKGNIRYDYFYSIDNEETVLLIDSWDNQETIDNHHASKMMELIIKLRNKYDFHMKIERFICDENLPLKDKQYVRE